MNREHLRAILSANGPVLVAERDGRIIASEGHIAAEADYPITSDPQKQSSKEGFVRKWKAWSESEWPEIKPGDEVRQSYKHFLRKIGGATIHEAFCRTFAGPDTTWHWTGNPLDPLVVKENGQLIGVVMPLRTFGAYFDAGSPAVPADAQVFGEFATEGNGYYLQDDQVLANEINDLHREIQDLEEKIETLESEKEEAEKELELKTERESCMRHFLVTIHADPISRNWRFG
jgi:hypothetical protein